MKGPILVTVGALAVAAALALFSGCAPTPAAPPQTAALTSHIQKAESSANAAADSAIKIHSRVSSAATITSRIDGKATVILENWR
jgi:hypothetical protein